MEKKIISEKEKKLKHVRVYDQLYRLIQDGVYPPGSQFPSEPDLAEQLHVSRMTLRRALALLQEDHLVQNIRGKGNFIRQTSGEEIRQNMDMFCHPVYNCCACDLDSPELELRVELPTESIVQLLGRCAAVVIADRWYRCKDKVSAYSLSFIPIEVISQTGLDLSRPEELKRYLETTVYESPAYSTLHISYTTTGNFTAAKYTLSAHSTFLLVQETVYRDRHTVLLSTKHYIPLELFEMQLRTKNGTV